MRKSLARPMASSFESPREPSSIDRRPVAESDRSDSDLYTSLLKHANSASWRAFLPRFEGAIRSGIACAARACRVFLSRDDRDEIRARFFVRLLANDMHVLRAYDPSRGKPPAGWISMLAERFAVDWVRARLSFSKLQQLDGAHLDGAHEELEHAVTPETLVAQKELILLIRRAKDGLPERQRELYDLYFEQDLDARDVAFRMGTTLQTVHACRGKIVERLLRAIEAMTERALPAAPEDEGSDP